jgi:dihydroorotase
MTTAPRLALWLSLSLAVPAGAQPYDLLIRGGRLIDPANRVDAVMDVAVAGSRIAAVGERLEDAEAETVVDASGLIVTPGLIDLHAHLFHGTEADSAYSGGPNALPPDGFTFRSGVTTAVDVGGSGWRDFPRFKAQVVDRSETRVLAFLNIVGSGMKGGPVEQDLHDMVPRLTALRAAEFPDLIVGVKVAHYEGADWEAVDRAVAAGEAAGLPVMVDFGGTDPALSLEALLLTHLRPGDVLTHAYAHVGGREPIVGPDAVLRPFVPRARERGVLFDVGHGAGSFVFSQAVPATRQGFYPDTISTDLHRASMNAGMKDLLNVMSKLLNLGMPVADVIRAASAEPARVIRREDLGHLGVGAEADVAVLRLRSGDFGFVDVRGDRLDGGQKLECELTLRGGRVVWDLNGLSRPPWSANPPGE